eukprot:gene8368-12907_t
MQRQRRVPEYQAGTPDTQIALQELPENPKGANRLLGFPEDEPDVVGKMWKSPPASVPKPIQFLLKTFSGSDVARAPEVAVAKPRFPEPMSIGAGNDLASLRDERSKLLDTIKSLGTDNARLKAAETANGEETRPRKVPKQPPLTVPLVLCIPLLIFAVVLGWYLRTADFDKVEFSPPVEQYVASLRSFYATSVAPLLGSPPDEL